MAFHTEYSVAWHVNIYTTNAQKIIAYKQAHLCENWGKEKKRRGGGGGER